MKSHADHSVLTLDLCPVCGLVSGQLGWDVETVAGECAGIVACGTDHDPVPMERATYLRSRPAGGTMEPSTNRGGTALTAHPRTTGDSAP